MDRYYCRAVSTIKGLNRKEYLPPLFDYLRSILGERANPRLSQEPSLDSTVTCLRMDIAAEKCNLQMEAFLAGLKAAKFGE